MCGTAAAHVRDCADYRTVPQIGRREHLLREIRRNTYDFCSISKSDASGGTGPRDHRRILHVPASRVLISREAVCAQISLRSCSNGAIDEEYCFTSSHVGAQLPHALALGPQCPMLCKSGQR